MLQNFIQICEQYHVAIPSDSGQVSTINKEEIKVPDVEIGSQSLLIQGRFQLIVPVDFDKEDSVTSQSLLIQGRFQQVWGWVKRKK